MSTSNAPFWASEWEKWFKTTWLAPQAGEAIEQNPAAAFAGLASMWLGSHPVVALPAGSMTSLMKDAAMSWTDLMRHSASHQAILLTGWQAAFAAFTKEVGIWSPVMEHAAEADTIDSLDQLVARWTATAQPVLQQQAKSEAFIS